MYIMRHNKNKKTATGEPHTKNDKIKVDTL